MCLEIGERWAHARSALVPAEYESEFGGTADVWTYEAAYLPAGASFPIVRRKGAIADPLIFISPGGKAPVVWSPAGQHDLQHCGSQRTLNYVRITRPDTASTLSAGLRWFCERGLLSIEDGDNYRMELVWDDRACEKTQKLDWPVPVRFRW